MLQELMADNLLFPDILKPDYLVILKELQAGTDIPLLLQALLLMAHTEPDRATLWDLVTVSSSLR